METQIQIMLGLVIVEFCFVVALVIDELIDRYDAKKQAKQRKLEALITDAVAKELARKGNK